MALPAIPTGSFESCSGFSGVNRFERAANKVSVEEKRKMSNRKFRVWDSQKNEWINPALVALIGSGVLMIYDNGWKVTHSKNLVVQFFTGLCDKNGDEVYDGDILKYTRFNWQCGGHPQGGTDLVQICKVYWSEKECGFYERGKWESGGGWSGNLTFDDHRADRNEIEIIGNIFKNPELLEQPKTRAA